MVQLQYNEDEFRLIAKRVKGVSLPKSRPERIKNNHAYSALGKSYDNKKNTNHVVVKITGGAKNAKQAREHLHYVTRNDELELYDYIGNVISLKQAKDETNELINELSNLGENTRRFYNVMFSRHGKTDPELLKKIVLETVQAQFPDNNFYYAVHDDTKNTHVHVIIERKGIEDKLLRIDKRKLNEVKKMYADIQNKYGLEAVFLSETDKQNQRPETLRQQEKREDKRKGANEYIVMDFGTAPYMFKEDGKPSFYLSLQTKNGINKNHWSIGLKQEIQKKGVKIGDTITLKKVQSLDTGELNEQGKFKKSDWKIEVLEQSQGLGLLQYKIMDFGTAPYKFDETGKPSYYLLVQDYQGKNRDFWGKALQEMISEQGFKIGDTISRDPHNPKGFIKQTETAMQTITQPLKQEEKGLKI